MKFSKEFLEALQNADRANKVTGSFTPISGSSRTVLFVDGGSGVIISAPNYAVAFIRVYATVWSGTVRKKSDTFEQLVLFERLKTSVRATLFGKAKTTAIEFAPEAKKIPADDVDRVRKHLEVQIAIAESAHLPDGSCVVLDGDLDAEEMFERVVLDELKSESGRLVVAGLSKTNRFISDDQTTLASDLAQSGPQGAWLYELKGGVGFVKLHAKSDYVFRLDSSQLVFAASALLPVSADPVFLGYPYPLVEADTHARVSFSELHRMKLELQVAVGKLDAGAALDAHAVLDALNH